MIKRIPKLRCVYAKALRSPAFKQRIVRNARAYDRKRDKRQEVDA